jgi:hypothetical protein
MEPLTGGCGCGAVRYRITADFINSNYCHCTRCQRRTGTGWSINASVPPEGFEITQGAEAVRTWAPEGGFSKSFCGKCGSALFSGGGDKPVGVRMGTLDRDPGIRPLYHQWVEASPAWAAIPDDGLPRYPRARPSG